MYFPLKHSRSVLWVAAALHLVACGPSSTSTSTGATSSAGGTPLVSSSSSNAAKEPTRNAIRLKQAQKMCLDVVDVKKTAGTKMQIWSCHYGDNQTFSMDDKGLIHVYGSMCLSTDGSDALVIEACDETKTSQQWKLGESSIMSADAQSCITTVSNAQSKGTRVGTSPCDASRAEQLWIVGTAVKSSSSSDSTAGTTDGSSSTSDDTPATSTGSTAKSSDAAKTLTNQAAASMASLKAKVPARLKAQMDNIQTAADKYNLQPQLLVAIAMEESTGGSDGAAYSNGGGMFQFTDVNTWKQFGTKNPDDRQNDALSVEAAAHYMASELNNSNGNLAAALRTYNGPIGQGGNPSYISDIYSKMAGNIGS